jgi:hypothetical protein
MTAADWGRKSRAERDAAYNNSAAVVDSAAHVARWTAASRAWRAAHHEHLDIPFAAKERTKWDLYPGPDADAPCLVHIHGGYWQRNSREVFACLAEGVARHGWSAALPGYTLAPDAHLVDIVGTASGPTVRMRLTSGRRPKVHPRFAKLHASVETVSGPPQKRRDAPYRSMPA